MAAFESIMGESHYGYDWWLTLFIHGLAQTKDRVSDDGLRVRNELVTFGARARKGELRVGT